MGAVVLRHIDEFEERFAAGMAASEELIPALDAMSGLRVERAPFGSNVFKLNVDGVSPEVVRTRLEGRDIVVPAPAASFRGFALKVNETLARCPVAETLDAFAQAV